MATRPPPPCWSLSTKRIRLVVAYDGTEFNGWTAQEGRRTIQGILTSTVRQISGEDNEIIGASRTDGGAHARGQVAHFDTDLPIDPRDWARILNRRLPRDVVVRRSQRVPAAFHSRFCAEDRTYRYVIRTGVRDPRTTRTVYEYGRPLDADRMHTAAQQLLGRHDFRAYSEELPPTVHAVRDLFALEVRQRGDRVEILITGTAFVRGMMRRISGGLLEVGRGRRPAEDLAALLDPQRRDLLHWPVVLPAGGLTLERVRYGRPLRDNRDQNPEHDLVEATPPENNSDE